MNSYRDYNSLTHSYVSTAIKLRRFDAVLYVVVVVVVVVTFSSCLLF